VDSCTATQDMAQAGTLAELGAAHAAFLRRAAARAFAPPDPGAHLLQGALSGLLAAVRQFTTRRAAAVQARYWNNAKGSDCSTHD
jgi:predicted YcjX-like family ATPase